MHRTRPPKKSETLEIRLPYEAKRAFMARCRDRGVSASDALRGFIDAEVDPQRRRRGWRLVVGGTAALAMTAAALPSLARTSALADFARLDRNADRRVTFAEYTTGAAVQVAAGPAGAPLARDTLREAGQARLRTLVLEAVFQRLDVDRDGAVSFDEYRRAGEAVRPASGSGPIAARSRA